MNRPRCCYRRFQHTGENSDSAALGFGLIRAWKERTPKLLLKSVLRSMRRTVIIMSKTLSYNKGLGSLFYFLKKKKEKKTPASVCLFFKSLHARENTPRFTPQQQDTLYITYYSFEIIVLYTYIILHTHAHAE